jgi:hypothetical protein
VTLSPLTRRLALFALLSSLLLNAVLAGLGEPTGFRELRQFATGVQGVDSWRPMSQAHAYLELDAEAPLYEWLFFEQRIKFIYPPTSLLLLDVVPRGSLRTVLNLLSWLLVLATAGFSVALLDRGLERSRFAAASPVDRGVRAAVAALLALSFYPLQKAYALGQMQVFVNALFAACVWCWVCGHRRTAGVLVTLMAAVKPQYGLIGLWGLLRREYRFVAAVAVSALCLLAVSLHRFGWESHWDYLSVVSHVSRHGEAYWPNQTLNGLLQRLLGNGVSSHWDPHVYPPYHPVVHLVTWAGGLALLGLALFFPGREPRGDALDLAAFVLAATIGSPIAWEHHNGVLLPTFALLLPAALERPRLLAPLALAWAVAANYWHPLARLDATAWNPLQSLLLFAALGVLVLCRMAPSVRRS